MNGNLVFCFAVVFVAQAVTASVIDGEEVRKIGDQFGQSGISIVNHITQMLGLPVNTTDTQKSYDKMKSFVTRGQAEWESDLVTLKDVIGKNVDPRIIAKINEIEKEIKKQTTDSKLFDLKKITDSILFTTKDVETAINKALDGVKKP
ncbi:Hypothetical protein CINCED_3A007237 [Cinara cedri]|uniref:Uncharacterized protein n=1 Tax=Cinara cedri TaxID=506608 RepID=A0A5E4MGW3_9HEMI|nr:Hypothetical protein CINCED_3A007237 [Cinara cedri]